MKFASLDVDGTVYRKSTSHDSINYLNEIGQINCSFHTEYWQVSKDYADGQISYAEVVQQGMTALMSSLNGLAVKSVEKLLKEYFLENHRIRPFAKPVVDYLHNEGYKTYLISAGIDPAIRAIADILGVTGFFTSTQKIVNSIYTDQDIKILHSDSKEQIVRSMIEKYKPEDTIGFGDTTGDIGILSLMDLGFVIHPHQQELIDLSEQKGWVITEDVNVMINAIKDIHSE